MSITTRIAPSPTGYLHFGLARTALYCYLFARKEKGSYVLRIEDTDIARNKPEYEEDINEQLTWLGLVPDVRYRQSDHRARHTACLKQLVESDRAYISKEPMKDDPSKEVSVVRLRNKGEVIMFNDLIRGRIRFDTTELGDFVIARSIDDPLYHVAVVIDDADEGVTHIIRGEDHISNTPRHILLQRALGFPTPVYAHIPLILMPDRSKMSKRKHESSVKAYREEGILPEALINYLALLGWNPGTDEEIFSLDQLVSLFDIGKVHKSGAVFDREKLLWVNHEYIRRLSGADFRARLNSWSGEKTQVSDSVIALLQERARTLSEAKKILSEEMGFIERAPTYRPDLLIQGAKGATAIEIKAHLNEAKERFSNLKDFSNESLKEAVFSYATEQGRAAVLWPLRVALTGMEKSPDPFTVASILGKEETISRINKAYDML